jgi:hypothetical protein
MYCVCLWLLSTTSICYVYLYATHPIVSFPDFFLEVWEWDCPQVFYPIPIIMHPTVGIFHVYTPTLSSLIPHPPPIFLRGVRNEAMPSVAQCNAQKSPALGKCYVDLCTVYCHPRCPTPFPPRASASCTPLALDSTPIKLRWGPDRTHHAGIHA